jgi:hypothetical protein
MRSNWCFLEKSIGSKSRRGCNPIQYPQNQKNPEGMLFWELKDSARTFNPEGMTLW